MDNVLQFAARPQKPPKPRVGVVGPIQAERERIMAIFTAPEAHGSWEVMARTLATETNMSANEIVAALKDARAKARAEIAADIAAGTF